MSYRLLLVSFSFLSCFDTSETNRIRDSRSKAMEILNKVWNKSNSENWSLLHRIKFDKQTHLYDSIGNSEMEVHEHHRYYSYPKRLIDISWLNSDGVNQIVEKEQMVFFYLNGKPLDSMEEENIWYKIRSSEYTLSLPHILRDTSKIDVAYDGISILNDGREVHIIKVIYPDFQESQRENQDIWWHLISTDDFSYIGYRVKHRDHINEVINRKSLEIDGIWLPIERDSYRMDISGEIQYLRARYHYSNYRIFYINENR